MVAKGQLPQTQTHSTAISSSPVPIRCAHVSASDNPAIPAANPASQVFSKNSLLQRTLQASLPATLDTTQQLNWSSKQPWPCGPASTADTWHYHMQVSACEDEHTKRSATAQDSPQRVDQPGINTQPPVCARQNSTKSLNRCKLVSIYSHCFSKLHQPVSTTARLHCRLLGNPSSTSRFAPNFTLTASRDSTHARTFAIHH